jgi:hypothetical protein
MDPLSGRFATGGGDAALLLWESECLTSYASVISFK